MDGAAEVSIGRGGRLPFVAGAMVPVLVCELWVVLVPRDTQ